MGKGGGEGERGHSLDTKQDQKGGYEWQTLLCAGGNLRKSGAFLFWATTNI